jgi:hypothetical protein
MPVDRSQFVTATGNTVSSLSAVFSSAVSSGSLILVVNAYFRSAGQTFTTVTDNVITAGFVNRINSTMASDTQAGIRVHEKINISSGRGASTYRISVNYNTGTNISLFAGEFTGGPFTFGSTGSSNGTSTGPRGPVQTASSTPVLFVGAAMHNSTVVFGSTALSQATYVTTVDPTNANQVLNLIQSTGSSLSQQITHSMASSTRWLAGCLLYTGTTVAAGGGVRNPERFTMLGMQ